MSNNMVKLGDIATFKTGPFGTQLSAKEYTSFGTPVINVKNIGYGSVVVEGIEYIGEETKNRLSEHILKKGDIVFGRKGSVDRHAYINDNCVGWMQGSDCIRVRCNEGINSRYISHYLKLDFVRKQITNAAVGSTMASLNVDILKEINISLPPIEIQDKIETFFTALEDKIVNNNLISETLLERVKTIYDYWFVQFEFPNEDGKPYKSSDGEMVWCEELNREIPKGWTWGNLYDIADYVNGAACQKYRPQEGEDSLPVIKIVEMHNGVSDSTERVSINIPDKHKVYSGDILFSWSASLEVMYWLGEDGGLNQHIFKVNPKGRFPKEYVYHQLCAYIGNFIKIAESRKTTMGHITSDHMKQSRIVLPKDDILEQFFSAVTSIHKKIIQIGKENSLLIQQRNWLLPLLMNGQATIE